MEGDALVIVGATPPAVWDMIVRLKLCGPAVPALLLTCTPNVYVPVAVGVPLKTPLLLNDKPEGSVPDVWAQIMGVVPEATNATE